ncbi:MAG: HAD-IIB family hydrolase [Bacilli bacterium]|nr:HAD-IIB family hydrolase [Bacilli bacterium]MDD4809170.1 HAD-IIB family hydrolase [Bacilli bacterium]
MKIIISDFDLTFFTDEYLENIKLINEFVNRGNMFIIATGRNITHLEKDIKGFNIDYAYLICNDGGIAFDSQGNCVYRKDIGETIVKPIFEMLKNDSNNIITFIDNATNYVNDPNAKANAIISQYRDIEKADVMLNNIISKYPSVHGYLSQNWINLTHESVNKATGIKALVKLFDLNEDNIYTIGDNINDLEMINEYHGYVVENGIDEIKVIAKGVVKSFKDLIKIVDESHID